ncbi:MAG: hypothetical protein GY798_08565 [Hyphomicrobiales bacterium]|nr:hypothetical protein [Hyphomicrobiales bacterium]
MDYRSVPCLLSPHTFYTLANSGPEVTYQGITFDLISQMVSDPFDHPKKEAPFFVPSDYLGHDGRSHEPQRQHGRFWYLTLDIDENNLAAEIVQQTIATVIGDCIYLMYSTSSASPQNRKWRVLIPLAKPLAGVDFEATQHAFFDMLEQADAQIVCDRALARTGQAVYLPNVPRDRRNKDGAPFFYQHYLVNSEPVDLVADHPIIVRREKNRADEAEIAAENVMARETLAAKRAKSGRVVGGQSPIEAFNKANMISSLLRKYGYSQAWDRDSWQSPSQPSPSRCCPPL